MFCTIKLSKSDPTPLYIQLATELAKLIREGIIPEKTKLPTIRSLSLKLKINRDTVVSAYKLLETEGLVVAHVGSGTYVAPISYYTPQTDFFMSSSNISCSVVNFSKSYFPLSLVKELTDKSLSCEGWAVFNDPLYRYRLLLKQSVCTYLKSVGATSLPAQVRLVKDFYDFLFELFKLSPKDCICVEAYHDLSYTSFMRSLGKTIIEIPLDLDGLNLEALEKHLKTYQVGFIWISSYIQNPTGISYSLQKKQALLLLAEKYNCYIIEDGTFSDFFYNSALLPLYTLSESQHVIYVYHFSKLYLPPLNYSFILLPDDLMRKLPDKLVCSFNERILQHYLDSPQLNLIRNNIIESSYKNYELILAHLLKSQYLSQIFCTKGGLFFWITPSHLSLSKVCDYFLQNNIIISPGELFSFKSKIQQFCLCISSLDESSLQLLLDAIDTF